MIKWNDEHTYGWNKLIDNIYYYIDGECKNFALFFLKFCISIPLLCFVGILAILQTIDWGVHLYIHMVDKQLQKPSMGCRSSADIDGMERHRERTIANDSIAHDYLFFTSTCNKQDKEII